MSRKISDFDLRLNKMETMLGEKVAVQSEAIITLQDLIERHSCIFPLKTIEDFNSFNEKLGNTLNLK